MRLLITRHGETFENVRKVCQDQIEGRLSENGIEQARKLALRLKGIKFDAVYSSDSKRTIDTSKEILKYHPGLKLNLDKRLRERFCGKVQGHPFPDGWDWNNLPDDCETDVQMCGKVKEFVDDIYPKHKGGTVLVVCHGEIILAFLTVLHNRPVSEFRSWEASKNASVSDFEVEENGNCRINLLNCVNHLEQ